LDPKNIREKRYGKIHTFPPLSIEKKSLK